MRNLLLHVSILLGAFCSIAYSNPINSNFLGNNDWYDLNIILNDEAFESCASEETCGDVSENDNVAFGTIYSLIAAPDEGELAFHADGKFCYTSNSVGTYQFSYEACVPNDPTAQEECSGKIKTMQVKYLGPAVDAALVVKGKKNGPVIANFSGVNPGDVLDIDATGLLNGVSATEWHFFVNGSLNAKIHTSCSVDILGQAYGGFFVIAYTDGGGNSNTIGGVECETATATIVATPCGSYFELVNDEYETCATDELCDNVSSNDLINAGTSFNLISAPSAGELVFNESGEFCYIPSSVGAYQFSYEACILEDVNTGPEECNGKVKTMKVQYVGTATDISLEVTGKNGGSFIKGFSGIGPNDYLDIDATGLLSGSSGTEWRFFINGELNAKIHTSCSVDILGKTYGDFYVVAYTDGNAGYNALIEEECNIAIVTLIVNSCDPCEQFGGDTDGDGYCDADDCEPGDPFYPAAAGTPCDDDDPMTIDDVVTADGCGCEGTPVSVCDNVKLGGYIGFDNCLGSYLYCPIFGAPPVITNCGDPEGGTGDLEIVWLQSTTSCQPPTTTFDNIENDPHWEVIPGANELGLNIGDITQNTCFLRCARRQGCDTYVESNIISLTIDTECLTFDRFGISIGDRVWIDLNGDGSQGNDEPGMDNIWVNLLAPNGATLATTNTDENGEYIFFGLEAGDYRLQFFVPNGFEVTLQDNAIDDDSDSDVNPLNGLTSVISLVEGSHPRNIDCGLRQAGLFLASSPDHFNFEVVKGDEHTELYWAHNAGKDVVDYAIERSTNGGRYEEITVRPSMGGTSTELYTDFDIAPATGDNHYRVKLYYTNGTIGYSEPILVHFADLIDFTVFPNPASDFVKVNLESVVGRKVDLQVINSLGIPVKIVELDQVYSKYYQIDLRDLKEGHYVLWVILEGHKSKAKQLVIGKP